MSIEKILAEYAESKENSDLQIQEIQKHQESEKNKAVALIVQSIEKNPSIQIDGAELKKALGRTELVEIIKSVNSIRPLNNEELTDECLVAIIQSSYASKNSDKEDFNLAEEVFINLDTDEKKVAFCLHANFTSSAIQESPSASQFFYEKFGLQKPYEECPTKLYTTSFRSDLNQIALTLSMTKEVHDGIEEVADSIFELINFNYSPDSIEIFESTLSRFTSYSLSLYDEKGSFSPTLREGRYKEQSFDGESDREKLINAIKHIANHHWYASFEE